MCRKGEPEKKGKGWQKRKRKIKFQKKEEMSEQSGWNTVCNDIQIRWQIMKTVTGGERSNHNTVLTMSASSLPSLLLIHQQEVFKCTQVSLIGVVMCLHYTNF